VLRISRDLLQAVGQDGDDLLGGILGGEIAAVGTFDEVDPLFLQGRDLGDRSEPFLGS